MYTNDYFCFLAEVLPIYRTKNGGSLTCEFRERESRRKNRLDSLLPVFLVIYTYTPVNPKRVRRLLRQMGLETI